MRYSAAEVPWVLRWCGPLGGWLRGLDCSPGLSAQQQHPRYLRGGLQLPCLPYARESDEDCFWPGFIPYTCVDNVCQAGTLPLKDCLGPEDCKDTCISPEGCDCVDGVCQPLPPKPPAEACVEDTDCEASCSDTAALGCGCMTLPGGMTACAQKCDATTPCPPTASGEAVGCNKGFCPPKNTPSLPLE